MKKKSRILIYPLIIMGLVLMLASSCKKKEEVPSLITSAVTEITKTTAASGGLITSDGSAAITARGVCWSTGETPTIDDSKTTSSTSAVTFTCAITGLTAGTTYYVRAYAMNSAGIGYGSAVSFTTQSLEVAVLSTSAVADITETTATGGGNITSDGGSAVTARGVCWSTGQTPTTADSKTTDGTGTGEFTSSITGLTANTTYYVRAYATNSTGTAYGTAVMFSTLQAGGFATVETSEVSNITQTIARSGGTIISDGGVAITESGVCWGTGATPTTADSKTTDGTATGSFISAITGLTANTTYYVRAYATNTAGTSYGTAVSFTTLEEGIEVVLDYDGNVYHTVTCGTQVWLLENLKTTHYNNGDPIPLVTDATEWSLLTTGARDYPNGDIANLEYGYLYNFYAVEDPRGLAPVGYHFPDYAEYEALVTLYGGFDLAGAALKETGTTHWDAPNEGATNESGWTGIGGGRREVDGSYLFFHQWGFFWTTAIWNNGTEDLNTQFRLHFDKTKVDDGSDNKPDGASARCIKDVVVK